MKIAIHNSKKGFSEHWVTYCEEHQIPYKMVNCYDTDIIRQLEDCDALMWHYHHNIYKDVLFAKQLLYSLEQSGKKVFPDMNTSWHFDDKVGQKYLLESIQIPFVPSYVFYTKKEALEWVKSTNFPKIFKLRNGAGSSNVKLVKNKKTAITIINKAFGKGFSHCDYLGLSFDSLKKMMKGRAVIRDVIKYLALYFFPSKFNVAFFQKQKGYVYFQDFIPNNEFDIRVIVIGEKAFAIKRICRENDFRASGSGNIRYEKSEIDERCVKIAFDINKTIKSQSIAYDFIFSRDNNPLIVEISYGFIPEGYYPCEGYWDREMNWYEGTHFDFCGWMVENLIIK